MSAPRPAGRRSPRRSARSLASQALLNVLSASRYGTVVDELRALVSGRFGTPPAPDRPGARARRPAAPPTPTRRTTPRRRSTTLRERAEGLASSEEELLLLGALRRGGRAAAARRSAAAVAATTPAARGVDQTRAERIRELVAHRPGVRDRRGDDRGGGDARLGARTPDVPAAARSSATRRSRCPSPASRLARPPANGLVRRRAPDGRHLLPRRRSRARRRSSRRATRSPPARRSASSRR